jgi:hypothetical protein
MTGRNGPADPISSSTEVAIVAHIADDALEQYVMRTLPDLEIEPLEVHLFQCSECRDRFVTALNAAANARLQVHAVNEGRK